jgi:hypothetical protein
MTWPTWRQTNSCSLRSPPRRHSACVYIYTYYSTPPVHSHPISNSSRTFPKLRGLPRSPPQIRTASPCDQRTGHRTAAKGALPTAGARACAVRACLPVPAVRFVSFLAGVLGPCGLRGTLICPPRWWAVAMCATHLGFVCFGSWGRTDGGDA